MTMRGLGVAGALLLMSCATPAATTPPSNSLAAVTSSRLEHFSSEADFMAYVREVRRIAQVRGENWAQTYKAIPLPPPPPPPPPPPVAVAVPSPSSPGDAVVVTGIRNSLQEAAQNSVVVDSITSHDIGGFPDTSVAEALDRVPGIDTQGFGTAPEEESITNVQTRGVDEGDIVKRIGHFLIVLQDGRLFTIDMRVANRPGLAFIDRINVYRDANSGTWYDEMLVYRNRIVVTGFSYQQNATEISVFSLSEDGHVAREAVFYMSSNDYYDVENYATRLVDDKLVVYTPLDLTEIDPERPMDWPVLRRWQRGEGRNAVMGKAERLFDAPDIYRPIQETAHPYVHSISTCDLGSTRAGDELACTATAFVAPGDHEFFIAPDGAYLWATQNSHGGDACTPGDATRFENGARAALYRAPFVGEDGAMFVRGRPRDQLGLASTATEFRALLLWGSVYCERDHASHITLKYMSAPLSDFAVTPHAIGQEHFTDVPGFDGVLEFEQRFTDTHLVYGARQNWMSYPPNATNMTARVVAVPLADPAHATVIDAPHNILRVERVGANAVLTGYRDNGGLSLSLLDLSATPRVASTTVLAHRYETEGRSHAFNSRVNDEGEGVMGIPTAGGIAQSGRWWWRSGASDVSFINVEDGALSHAGELVVHADGVDDSYRCEVSCVDWYGNSRPIFTDGRIFALLGTELVEGAIAGGRMQETRRLNLSAPPGRR